MRMIKEVKKGKPDAQVQILLFSATFDDTIKTFAHNIVGGAANQVIMTLTHPILLQCMGKWQVQMHCNQTNTCQSWHRKACSQTILGSDAGVPEKGATEPGCDQAMQGEMPNTTGQADGAQGKDLPKL